MDDQCCSLLRSSANDHLCEIKNGMVRPLTQIKENCNNKVHHHCPFHGMRGCRMTSCVAVPIKKESPLYVGMITSTSFKIQLLNHIERFAELKNLDRRIFSRSKLQDNGRVHFLE